MRKAHAHLFIGCILLIITGTCLPALAQEPAQTDTTQRQPLEGQPVPVGELAATEQIEVIDTLSKLIPAKAAFYSAVLPGLGQAYNDSHWKIPVIYIGGAFIAYLVNFNNQQYSQAIQNFRLIALDPRRNELNGRNQDYYQRRASFYRRQRDYTIIIGGLLYGLNIVEAYVDAHLQDFDLNDDLAMRIKPSLLAGGGIQPGAGITLTFQLK